MCRHISPAHLSIIWRLSIICIDHLQLLVHFDDAIFSLCEEYGTRMGTTEKRGLEDWVIGNIYDFTVLTKLSTETSTNLVVC